jgi:type IV secretory pathway TraG/TraD family ATPase VirD4
MPLVTLATLPNLPWYTLVALALLCLFILGSVWALVRLALLACGLWCHSAWYAFWALVARLLGAPSVAYGSAHWATRRELARAGLWNEDGLPLATSHTGRTLREPRGNHVCVIAPPRSGKSFGIVMPVLRQFRGSAIVTDLRAELHLYTAEERTSLGRVFLFNPADDQTCSLNLLDNIRWGSTHQFADVDRVAQHLLAPTGSDLGDDFRRHAVPLLRAVMMQCRDAGDGHFPGVAQWFTSPASMDDKLDALAHAANPHVRAGGRRTQDMGERLKANVWSVCTESLTIFEDPQIIAHTTTSDCLLSQLIDGLDPTTIYLTLSFADVRRLGRFLGLFVELFCALVSSPHAPARHQVLLCLDECANLGRLRELEAAMSYLQGSGCQTLLVFQNLAQIQHVYGDSPLLSSIGSLVAYTPTPTDTLSATMLARSLGQATVAAPAVHSSEMTTSVSESLHARSLLTVDEILRFPQTDALILTQGCAPIWGRKLGSPPLARWVRSLVALRRHPGLALTAAGACLLALMLHPLWAPSLPAPAPLQAAAALDQSGYWNSSIQGTPTPPNLPQNSAGSPTAPPALPWQLEVTDSYAFLKKQPELLAFATESDCQALIAQRYRSQLNALTVGLAKRPPTHHGYVNRDTPSEVDYAVGPFDKPRQIHALCRRSERGAP